MSRAWMPLYVADYLADTGHLTTAEHGAYLLLIMHYWANGGLPNDEHRLARIARMTAGEWADARITLKGFFDDNWTHKRIDGELSKARSKTEFAKNNGTFGAVAKWGSTQSTDNRLKRSERLANARRLGRHSPEEWQALLSLFDGCVKCGSTEKIVKDHIKPIYQGGSDGIDNLQPLCHSCNSSKGPDNTDYRSPNWRERLAKRLANASLPQSQSQVDTNVSTKTREARSLAVQAAFDSFWRHWPHKVGKPAAEKAFAKVSGEIEAILLGVDRYVRDKPPDRPWLNPATFLNQRRWEDAPAIISASSTDGLQTNGRGGFASLLAKSMGLKNGRQGRHSDEAVSMLSLDYRGERADGVIDDGELFGDAPGLLDGNPVSGLREL